VLGFLTLQSLCHTQAQLPFPLCDGSISETNATLLFFANFEKKFFTIQFKFTTSLLQHYINRPSCELRKDEAWYTECSSRIACMQMHKKIPLEMILKKLCHEVDWAFFTDFDVRSICLNNKYLLWRSTNTVIAVQRSYLRNDYRVSNEGIQNCLAEWIVEPYMAYSVNVRVYLYRPFSFKLFCLGGEGGQIPCDPRDGTAY
jgi:hypothetical protein